MGTSDQFADEQSHYPEFDTFDLQRRDNARLQREWSWLTKGLAIVALAVWAIGVWAIVAWYWWTSV